MSAGRRTDARPPVLEPGSGPCADAEVSSARRTRARAHGAVGYCGRHLKSTPVMVMAGGRGSRLGPLACYRAKPAMPFAGRYRLIDFVLSNLINSGYRRVYLLTQFMATSLIRHVNHNWRLSGMGEFIEVVPAQMRAGECWYEGTADSVYQNLHLLQRAASESVAVFGSDHVYTFAVDQLEEAHYDQGADLTVAAFPVPRSEARRFGVLQVDARGRVTGFEEKPAEPVPLPGQPDTCLVSMGNYIFRTEVLYETLRSDAQDESSEHDFGKSIVPKLVKEGARVFAYDFRNNRIPGALATHGPYWRDVGTIDSFFGANMDVLNPLSSLDLYNPRWQIRSAQRHSPPAQFSLSDAPADVVQSMVGEGSIVANAKLAGSLLGYDCLVQARAVIENSVIFSGCDIGRDVRLRRVLMDKNCSLAPGVAIGHDPTSDAERFPFISDAGVVVLPKGTHVPRTGPILFAPDVAQILRNDPVAGPKLQTFSGKALIEDGDLSSHQSVGPRRNGRGKLSDGKEPRG